MKVTDFLGKKVLDKNAMEIGKVSEMEIDPLKGLMGWIQIDHSEMWYNSESMEVLGKNNNNSQKSSRNLNAADALEKAKKSKKDLSDVAMGTGTCDGGG